VKIVGLAPVCTGGKSFSGTHVPTPLQLCHQIRITKVRFRIAMALQTPAHAQRLGLPNNFHSVDSAVTFDATDASQDVRRVVEEGVVR
jgi:hypothetical protein